MSGALFVNRGNHKVMAGDTTLLQVAVSGSPRFEDCPFHFLGFVQIEAFAPVFFRNIVICLVPNTLLCWTAVGQGMIY